MPELAAPGAPITILLPSAEIDKDEAYCSKVEGLVSAKVCNSSPSPLNRYACPALYTFVPFLNATVASGAPTRMLWPSAEIETDSP